MALENIGIGNGTRRSNPLSGVLFGIGVGALAPMLAEAYINGSFPGTNLTAAQLVGGTVCFAAGVTFKLFGIGATSDRNIEKQYKMRFGK